MKSEQLRDVAQQAVLVDENGAAAILGGERPLSPRTLQQWRLRGFGPKYLRIGRNIRYQTSELYKWMELRTVASTSEK